MNALREIAREDLVSVTETSGSSIRVRLVGSAEMDATLTLDAFLKSVHAEAMSARVGAVVFDVRALEFMSSSCFKAFVSWVSVLQDLPSEDQYRVRFMASEGMHWQSRSLGALACFAVDLVTVEST